MLPGIVVGVGSALALILLSVVAGQLEDVLWTWLPQQVGIDGTSPAWTIGMLTAVGLAAGLVVTFVPGHAGPTRRRRSSPRRRCARRCCPASPSPP